MVDPPRESTGSWPLPRPGESRSRTCSRPTSINDYLTGGLTLARATGAAYHVNAADAVAVNRVRSLLHGSTGRPDLLGAEHAATLAAAQHASARRLAATLPGAAGLDDYPAYYARMARPTAPARPPPISPCPRRPAPRRSRGASPPGNGWSTCAGYRASVAASVLHASGRPVVAIDDEFGNAVGRASR